mmetsp:Transcript_15366/g.34876  ORF Transcript_15366/g.34876 Transcript_15366/m.34876 type:complete len:207 (+) Transcript_15366:235-855(+)
MSSPRTALNSARGWWPLVTTTARTPSCVASIAELTRDCSPCSDIRVRPSKSPRLSSPSDAVLAWNSMPCRTRMAPGEKTGSLCATFNASSACLVYSPSMSVSTTSRSAFTSAARRAASVSLSHCTSRVSGEKTGSTREVTASFSLMIGTKPSWSSSLVVSPTCAMISGSAMSCSVTSTWAHPRLYLEKKVSYMLMMSDWPTAAAAF